MSERRRMHGIVLLCTLVAGTLAPVIWAEAVQNPEIGSQRARQQLAEAAMVKGIAAGILAGFAIGLACDLAVNGWPRQLTGDSACARCCLRWPP